MSALRDIEFEGVSASDLAALQELVRLKWELQALQAQREQEVLAAQMPETNAIDGLGPVSRQIHDFAFHDWAIKEGSYDCWKDKGFNKYIDRIAPETKPVSRGLKPGNGMALQVGWMPVRAPRFRKSYGDRTDGTEKTDAASHLSPLTSPFSP